MKLLWIVPGFGEPYKKQKEHFFTENRKKIGRKIDIKIFEYNKENPGIVGQFLKAHCHPWKVRDYDIILVSLDDVEFTSAINWEQIQHYLYKDDWDMLLPSVANNNTVFPHIRTSALSEPIVQTTTAEFFCYFFKPKSYATWWGYLRDYNPWLWGMDLNLHMNMLLKVGLMRDFTILHHYKGGSEAGSVDRVKYFEEMGVTMEQVAQQKCFLDG